MDNELQNEIEAQSIAETEPIAPPSEIETQSTNETEPTNPPTQKKKKITIKTKKVNISADFFALPLGLEPRTL